ncbi:MAG: glycosyltransferase family 2 protein, partial [Candidatus Cybelea sp.]
MTTVTVVVPAYNESQTFAASLVTISDYFTKHRGGGYEFNYLIVDDGSSDETYAVASNFAGRRRDVRVLRHERNRGLGAALRTAFSEVDSELAVVLDADLSYSPATAMELIELLDRQHADIALASPYA